MDQIPIWSPIDNVPLNPNPALIGFVHAYTPSYEHKQSDNPTSNVSNGGGDTLSLVYTHTLSHVNEHDEKSEVNDGDYYD